MSSTGTLFDSLPVMTRPPRTHFPVQSGNPVSSDEAPADARPLPTVRITVDGHPVPKGRPRIGVNKHTGRAMAFTPSHTRKYEDYVKLLASEAMEGRTPLDQPLCVVVEAYLPIAASWSKKKQAEAMRNELLPVSRPDADNFLKIALDALNGIVYRDDSLVTDMHVTKRYSEKPRLEIEVYT